MEAGVDSGRIAVPAGAARAIRLPEGQRVRVVNSEGGQVVDTWAFCASDPAEHLSMAHSRSATYRIFFRVGDALVDEPVPAHPADCRGHLSRVSRHAACRVQRGKQPLLRGARPGPQL